MMEALINERPAVTISPEQQLRNVAACLLDAVQSGRHDGRAYQIRASAEQLVTMLDQYLDGKLEAIADDPDQPF
jgi:hypothetical protein